DHGAKAPPLGDAGKELEEFDGFPFSWNDGREPTSGQLANLVCVHRRHGFWPQDAHAVELAVAEQHAKEPEIDVPGLVVPAAPLEEPGFRRLCGLDDLERSIGLALVHAAHARQLLRPEDECSVAHPEGIED